MSFRIPRMAAPRSITSRSAVSRSAVSRSVMSRFVMSRFGVFANPLVSAGLQPAAFKYKDFQSA